MFSSLDDMGVVRSVPSRVGGRESVSATTALHVGQKEAQGEWIAGPTECPTVCSHVRHDPSIIGDSVEPSDVELHAAQGVAQDVHTVASGSSSAPMVDSAPAIRVADNPWRVTRLCFVLFLAMAVSRLWLSHEIFEHSTAP